MIRPAATLLPNRGVVWHFAIMPIVDEVSLLKLLESGQIDALSVDTNIFDEKALQLNGAALQAISSLSALHFDFLLSGTVAREIRRHLLRSTTDSLRGAKKAIGAALAAFDTDTPTRDDIIAMISGGQTAEEAAAKRFNDYIRNTNCQVLDDTALVDTATIFDAYFASDPPFGTGAKKSEFPDALALWALERIAEQRNKGIIVVSKDGDWLTFCKKSTYLYLVPDIERALSLINQPPVILRAALSKWLAEDYDAKEELQDCLTNEVEKLEFMVQGNATSGEMEAYAMAPMLIGTGWPEVTEIDVLEIVTTDGDQTSVTISLPLLLTLKVPIEVEFSVWDSIDRESLSMGGKSIEYEEEFDIRATVDLAVQGLGTDNEKFKLVGFGLDASYLEVDLGEVNVFEPEDYDIEN
ncbi:PIN domain-containing protein [Rhizobium sp. 'Codium 1']|uniref:PIN domain-containing protein n=1 Tax=Rhizobium sp. 'Codium 1' TaxID=2940484 RepID=UPI001E43C7B8|nr:PIN domain-containing protein [Rhizobium sp. 'Codium 1']MCC8934895.1 PIN domain-containing protein [Rhizobium sp. 'Codium 1']